MAHLAVDLFYCFFPLSLSLSLPPSPSLSLPLPLPPSLPLSPPVGIALAIAIALHNIPEGVCVAMPVYYSSGSKLKAFLWAFLSGVSEPIGELSIYIVRAVSEL